MGKNATEVILHNKQAAERFEIGLAHSVFR